MRNAPPTPVWFGSDASFRRATSRGKHNPAHTAWDPETGTYEVREDVNFDLPELSLETARALVRKDWRPETRGKDLEHVETTEPAPTQTGNVARVHRFRAAPKVRKITKFEVCTAHASPRAVSHRRRAEFFSEGGLVGTDRCMQGAQCRIWPGTDLFAPSVCTGEADWPTNWRVNTQPATGATGPLT